MSSFLPSKFWTHLKSKFQRFNPLRREMAKPEGNHDPNNSLEMDQVKTATKKNNTGGPAVEKKKPHPTQTCSKSPSFQKGNRSTTSRNAKGQKTRHNRARFVVPVGVGRRRRPPGPFVFYLMAFLKNAQRNAGRGNPSPQLRSVTKEAAKAWKKLSQEEKEVYRQRHYKEAAQIKARTIVGKSSGRKSTN